LPEPLCPIKAVTLPAGIDMVKGCNKVRPATEKLTFSSSNKLEVINLCPFGRWKPCNNAAFRKLPQKHECVIHILSMPERKALSHLQEMLAIVALGKISWVSIRI
jgi:hypothetical protein